MGIAPWPGDLPPEAGRPTDGDRKHDATLQAAREMFPGWDFHPVFAGWLAVPAGTPVIQSVDLDGITAKLREHLGKR